MSGDLTRQRAELEDVIAGRTLCDELRHVAETAGDGYAYSDEDATGAGPRAATGDQEDHRP